MTRIINKYRLLLLSVLFPVSILMQLFSAIPANAAATTAPLGTNTPLTSTGPVLVSYKGASQYSVAENGTISSLNMYLDGLYGTSGTQSISMAVYSDSSNKPNTVLQTTSAKTINAGRAAGWVNFSLNGTLSVTTGEKLWLAAYSPSGTNIIRIYYDTAANYLYTNNVNSGTPISSPFGTNSPEVGRYDMYATETLSASNSAGLTTWQTALANRSTTPAKWVNIGDSISEGQGADYRSNRWLDLSAAALRTNYPTGTIVGGENYIPAIYDVFGVSAGWGTPYTASSGSFYPDNEFASLGYRNEVLSTGASLSYPVTGDSADIWYTQGDTGGTFTYQVDNGTPVSVNSYSQIYNTGAEVTNVSLGTSGSHTITITDTSGNISLEGFTVYNGDRSAGIQVYDSGETGATSSAFLYDLPNFTNTLATVSPQLVTIELGENDYGAQTAPATYKSNIQQLVSAIETLPSHPSIELIAAYQGSQFSTPPTYPYSTYVQQLQAIATADPTHVAFLDLSATMPPATGQTGQQYYETDGHPNDTGEAKIESLVYSSLTK